MQPNKHTCCPQSLDKCSSCLRELFCRLVPLQSSQALPHAKVVLQQDRHGPRMIGTLLTVQLAGARQSRGKERLHAPGDPGTDVLVMAAPPDQSPFPLLALPDGVLAEIAQHLGPVSLATLQTTCKHLDLLFGDDRYVRHIPQQYTCLHSSNVQKHLRDQEYARDMTHANRKSIWLVPCTCLDFFTADLDY